ncbi:hypothetical protein Tco_1284912, partial [Tanacetum coccineum]
MMNQHLNTRRLLEFLCEELETNNRHNDINDLVLRSLLLHKNPEVLLLPNKITRGRKHKFSNNTSNRPHLRQQNKKVYNRIKIRRDIRHSREALQMLPNICGDPNHLIGECPKPPKDKNQRAFVGGSWSDSGEEDDEKVKDEMCLVAHVSSE